MALLDLNAQFYLASIAFFKFATTYHDAQQYDEAIANFQLPMVVHQEKTAKGEKYLLDALTVMLTSNNAMAAFEINHLLAILYLEQGRIAKLKKKLNSMASFAKDTEDTYALS